jgi:O-methyltransferase involved in polyketide biosynthesis
MDPNQRTTEPDNTAVRTALWRALHMLADAQPRIIEDEVGLKLVAPTWRLAGASRYEIFKAP